MRLQTALAKANLVRRPVRSVALAFLSLFLAFTVFGGSVIVLSLKNGLNSYEERLGADVVAVPSDASIRGELESILLQGIPGYFYMNASVMDKIAAIEGVEAVSPQFFLASTKSGCCSVALQLIGFDPETDFTIMPWVERSYSGTVGKGDVLIGNHVSMPASRKLTFYNQELSVVGQLDETGTSLDNAVYADMETVRGIIKNAEALGFQYLGKIRADDAISSCMIRVADGYSIDAVCNYINIHIRKVDATKSQRMIASVADGLNSISSVIAALTVVIWLLAAVILTAAFFLLSGERKKEFAVLRSAGASAKQVRGILFTESALVTGIGAIIGTALAALVAIPFSGLIRTALSLPYLLPDVAVLLLLALGTVLLCVVTGTLSAVLFSKKTLSSDPALLLREAA